jgi:14-3-3 protein epsilon
MSRLDRPETLDREELLYLARLAEQSERYDEMVIYVAAFVNKDDRDLSVEERNILSVAYKNVVGTRRQAWRVLHSIEGKEERRNNADNKARAEAYRRDIENELVRLCKNILDLIDERLLPHAASAEGRVFYHKMKGDYYRYVCEFAKAALRDENSTKALASYQSALDVATNELPPTHPTRLGLALNFSVFYYEIMQNQTKACEMAKQAFDDAIPELDNISEESYKDSTLIMQLLRDNLTLWTSEAQDEAK